MPYTQSKPRDPRMTKGKPTTAISPLTRRESELYNLLIGTNLNAKSIAHRMGLSWPTIKVYTSRIYLKLSVSGRVEIMHGEIERLGVEIKRLSAGSDVAAE